MWYTITCFYASRLGELLDEADSTQPDDVMVHVLAPASIVPASRCAGGQGLLAGLPRGRPGPPSDGAHYGHP